MQAMTAPTSRYDAQAPFTTWPDPERGFMVLDLRTMAWAAGPFPTAAAADEAMDLLNGQVEASCATRRNDERPFARTPPDRDGGEAW